jgi:hypothetical protein
MVGEHQQVDLFWQMRRSEQRGRSRLLLIARDEQVGTVLETTMEDETPVVAARKIPAVVWCHEDCPWTQ